jgi:hypothetical protein
MKVKKEERRVNEKGERKIEVYSKLLTYSSECSDMKDVARIAVCLYVYMKNLFPRKTHFPLRNRGTR